MSSTVTVWQFDTTDGAGQAAQRLEQLAHQDLVAVGAALVEWDDGDRRPRTRQLALRSRGGLGLGGGFWGLLFGLVFFVPLLGAAMGATTGALAGALTDVGIDDHFINRVRDQVTPGTSALFLLITTEGLHELQSAYADAPPSTVITTELDEEQEAALRSVFGD